MRICVIPCRGGSRRIPRKGITLFHGKPIIAYSIETARAANIFDQIFVSTDDEEIRDVAWKYGAKYVERPAELGRDEIGTQAVMRHAVEQISQGNPRSIGTTCCIYPCAPLLLPNDLFWALSMQTMRPCRYVNSVATDPLRDIGNFYLGDAIYFANNDDLWCTHTGLYVMPPERALDINTPEDWTRAEELYSALPEKDKAYHG